MNTKYMETKTKTKNYKVSSPIIIRISESKNPRFNANDSH